MAVTQRDIADTIGVSTQLVGYALNGSGRVGEATRRKVLLEAQRLGYRPNKAARAMVTGRSHQVALWMHSLTEPYTIQVQECVRAAVNATGFDLVVRCGQDTPSNSLLDGMLALASPSLPEADSLEWIQGVPLVVMGISPLKALPHCDTVGVEVQTAAEAAVRHLQQAGCRRIAFLAVHVLMREDEPRCAGYRAVMRKSKMPIEEISVAHELPIRTDSCQTLLRHIKEHGVPDGLLCGNDDTALGAMRALRDLGLKVPQDVKVIGCDGTPDALDATPPLSTIALQTEEMCQAAWKMLEHRLEDPHAALQQRELQAELILRDSSR